MYFFRMAPPEQYNSFNIGSAGRVQFFGGVQIIFTFAPLEQYIYFLNSSAGAVQFLYQCHRQSSAIF